MSGVALPQPPRGKRATNHEAPASPWLLSEPKLLLLRGEIRVRGFQFPGRCISEGWRSPLACYKSLNPFQESRARKFEQRDSISTGNSKNARSHLGISPLSSSTRPEQIQNSVSFRYVLAVQSGNKCSTIRPLRGYEDFPSHLSLRRWTKGRSGLNRCVTICSAPRSTANAPYEQCENHEQSQRTRVRVIVVIVIGLVRVAGVLSLMRRCQAMIVRSFAVVAFAHSRSALAPLGVANDHNVTREGYLATGSRVSEGVVVLVARNQKWEKQNADGRQ